MRGPAHVYGPMISLIFARGAKGPIRATNFWPTPGFAYPGGTDGSVGEPPDIWISRTQRLFGPTELL